ncbi:DUF2752 domain-containing protein [Umezakia ovalisporum]|uniref:DUF2752 domain-containing protein n=2 Tax=Umezakia ovalisporum TaxID=75695 RepID=A0AA43GVN1_9CYAN|nr:DUF2752 domain-containing protein [Umezakia ovalisporum]MDH6056395.1 DUF2752 domain-containing protein [Umezakia ovalisporum FSS-43]MDH6062221.1 DUF2752 domain-containing protein [Umezakia ovalisporum FSS-62]MDH6068095.1 DUF2752 domain-containing protein [Umezakia ovalisporum APH033B]MDH6077361.1 DUF2752 domain-containing protein [Umezakia ovalisporum FSS-45]MDH6081832.1 DUF2752 domain-containing protein [Umezakia ovalisporum FSS-44]MDH6083354.1 DUF2752 domain-containing protein [Umezakia 
MRWGILGFSYAPLLGTYFYNQNYRIAFLVCPIRHLTGIPCPTCGMTRSFMAIGRGDWSQAIAEHLFGPLLFASFVVAIVHITLELLTRRRVTAFYFCLLRLRKLQILGLFTIFIYYCLRLYYLSQTGEMYTAVSRSPVGQLLSTVSIK